MTQNPVGWFEIYVDDMQRAKKFYETVLKTSFQVMPNPTDDGTEMLAFPMDMEAKNTVSGALVKMDGFKAGNNSTLVYFVSDDCSIEEERVADAGGTVVKSKTSLGEYGNMIIAMDTEGNMFGVHSMG